MNGLRRLASLPGLRLVLLHPPVRRRVAAVLALRFLVAAWVTTAPWAVLSGEVVRRGTTVTYRLRDGGRVSLQHGRDLEALYEIFVRGEYEPPGPLTQRLAPDRVRRIVDVGANVGMFAAWAGGRWPSAQISCIEPDPANSAVLRTWARSAGRTVTIVEAAAAVENGTLTLLEGLGSGSRLTTAAEVDRLGLAVEAVDVLPSFAAADLVKMDIEGGEWLILADPRLVDTGPLVLVLEYHRVGAPSLPAQDAARRLLEAAGFSVGFVTPNHWGHGTMWAWKD